MAKGFSDNGGIRRGKDGYLINDYGNVWGYIRVSTAQQHTDRQLDALEDYGVRPEHFFIDKESGKNFNRPAYKKLIRCIRKGDLIVILSLDRLGRNYQDIQDQWRMITQDLGCGIHVIDMPLLNTSGDPADLMSKFITDMMLQVLSFVAENERVTTIHRQRQGIESAKKKKDVKIGRPRKPMPFDFWEIYLLWREKKFGTNDLFRYCHETYGMSNRTYYRRLNELNMRFGDIEPEKLRKLMLDKSYFDGIPFDNERLEFGIDFYNKHVLNNPEKERKLREKRRLEKEEHPELTKEEEYAMMEEMLKKRQKEFREMFNIHDPEDCPEEMMKTKSNKKSNTKQISHGMIQYGHQAYNKHTLQSGVFDAVELVDENPITPDIEDRDDYHKTMKTVVII